MLKPVFLLPLFVLLTGLSACCKRKFYCKPEALKVAFVGFSRTEIRNITLKRYSENDTGYRKAIDSSQLVYSGNAPVVANKKDTLWLSDYTSNGDLDAIYDGNNWRLLITNLKYDYYITDIADEEHRYDIGGCGDKEKTCTNLIRSISLNGNTSWGTTLYLYR